MKSQSVLDQFEAAWSSGAAPDLREFVDRCLKDGRRSSVQELCMIDLERRWRASDHTVPRNCVEQYLTLEQMNLDDSALLDLICWEYEVRNRWGDCPGRGEILVRFPQLRTRLEPALKTVAEKIAWPVVTITENTQVLAQRALDGPAEIGRQREAEPQPVSIVTQADGFRCIVAAVGNASISRSQLQIRLVALEQVQLRNCSSNRALAISGAEPLDAGMTRTLFLPVQIHLWDGYFLRICGR